MTQQTVSPAALVEHLRGWQTASGAFTSRIVFREHVEDDANGFVTALVLRHLPALPELDALRQRALDFLERCESTVLPGAFGFWPMSERPAWAGRVPTDIDDTAIMNLELARHGRRSRQEVQRVVYERLMPSLLSEVVQPAPPWITPLVFPTWLAEGSDRQNPVDCCVNANVVALMRWCGLTALPGYPEACAMIDAALTWAGDDMLRLSTLTPYYPHPQELLYALSHAVACGVKELEQAHARLSTLMARHPVSPRLQGVVCGNAYSGPYWVCPALEMARARV
jgi:hypothetical protein